LSFRSEALDVRRVNVLPALGWSPWRLFIVEVIDEDVEAYIPSCGVARGFAQVIELVHPPHLLRAVSTLAREP
jgi:hypothetical protein